MPNNSYKSQIEITLSPLFKDFEWIMSPASSEALVFFENTANEMGLDANLIKDLKGFYEVVDGIDLDVSIFSCSSPELYEFWKDDALIWIGNRDMDLIKYKDGDYHVGSSSYLNYGAEYVFTSLLDLLKAMLKEWYPDVYS